MKKAILSICVIIVGLFFIGPYLVCSPMLQNKGVSFKEIREARDRKTPPSEEEEKVIATAIKEGFIDKVNPKLNEVFVNPSTWANTKYEDKEMVARFLARYCGKKNGDGIYRVDIKDMYSGKKLAQFDEVFGFKTE